MEKKTLYSRDDFDNWYHDRPKYVGKIATKENEPNKYPCVLCWNYVFGERHNIYYTFIYIDDFV